ncbi:hypothetical protein EZV62_013799 [Acer yangbiense]|uniref:Uncharacterized protein n=1 Tax=Acer yangbiense TaxID=1000413 RepID=A0A5C7HSH7_9ROSI|nr:hypothetical protein EZV62_013799 [Acer yangbiense]
MSTRDFIQVAFFVFSPSLIASSLANNVTVKSIGIFCLSSLAKLVQQVPLLDSRARAAAPSSSPPYSASSPMQLSSPLATLTATPHASSTDQTVDPNLTNLIAPAVAPNNVPHTTQTASPTSPNCNLGNMPLIIIPAVCKERGSPFGNAGVCYNQGIAYTSLSMAIGSIYMWLYVYNIVRIFSSKNSEIITKPDNIDSTIKSVAERAENVPNSRTGPLLPLNIGCSPKEDRLDSPISEGKPKVG